VHCFFVGLEGGAVGVDFVKHPATGVSSTRLVTYIGVPGSVARMCSIVSATGRSNALRRRQTTLAEQLNMPVLRRYIDGPVRSCRTRSPTAYRATWVSRPSSTNPRMRSLSDRGSMPARHYRDTPDSPLLPIGHSPY
jgi:hypothetical protein